MNPGLIDTNCKYRMNCDVGGSEATNGETVGTPGLINTNCECRMY